MTTPDREQALGGWQTIDTAPRDGTTVRVGRRKFFQQWPLFPLRARFVDGRWLTDYGNDKWRSFEPQPNCWMPLPPAPDTVSTNEVRDE